MSRIPPSLHRLLFSRSWLMCGSLLGIVSYLASGLIFLLTRPVHCRIGFDRFTFTLLAHFWRFDYRWVLPVVALTLFFLAIVRNRTIQSFLLSFDVLLERKSGLGASRSRGLTKANVTLFVLFFNVMLVVVPFMTVATHSPMFLYLLVPVFAGPWLFCCGFACVFSVEKQDVVPPLAGLIPARIPYDVLVVEGCSPLAVERVRREFLDEDGRLGLGHPDLWDYLRPPMRSVFENMEKFSGGIIRKERIVFVESAWDAFSRVIDRHSSGVDHVLTTTIEPAEMTRRLKRSSAAGKVRLIEVADGPHPGDMAQQSLIRSITEEVGRVADVHAYARAHHGKTDPCRLMLVFSQVDCRTGGVFNLAQILDKCAEMERTLGVQFIYLLNAQHSLGNMRCDSILFDRLHYVVGDANHWMRGGNDLGLILLGGRVVEMEGVHGIAVTAEDLASGAFSIYTHCESESRPTDVLAPARNNTADILAFGRWIEDMADVICDSHANSGLREYPDTTIARHNQKLALLFTREFKRRMGPFTPFGLCEPHPKNGIIALYIKPQEHMDLSIEAVREELAQCGIQCKMLSSNHPGIHKPDRLRFCFHYYHGSAHVDRIVTALARSYGGMGPTHAPGISKGTSPASEQTGEHAADTEPCDI